MLISSTAKRNEPLWNAIINAYRMDESACIDSLLPWTALSVSDQASVLANARQIAANARNFYKKQGKVASLLHQYDLSTDEGIALMCLAEALLRIPDKATMDRFISDKISTVQWSSHLDKENTLFVNAATWSLFLTGKIYAPTLLRDQDMFSKLKQSVSRLGVAMVRPVILQMMRVIGKQFVIGENIHSALNNAVEFEKKGYSFSYDMLGEAARTNADAQHYFEAYNTAIEALGKIATGNDPTQNPGISVKLSALHPRYEYTQEESLLKELTPKVLALAKAAKACNIGLTIDAEEADRLGLSLNLFEKLYTHSSLQNWQGLGLAIQAYQKRALPVLDWVADLAAHGGRSIMVRLVKGAYWDSEIKYAQIQGFSNYPVFTRKTATDVSYLACAQKMLSLRHYFYPQFGTHNAYSIAAIRASAKKNGVENYEFQCLHGMASGLYDQIINKVACRIYAPVGTHRDLLGYLIRRLLENGANSSFINQLAEDKIPIEKLVRDPVARIVQMAHKPHPHIPLPKDIYGKWENSQSIDFSNPREWTETKEKMMQTLGERWVASSILARTSPPPFNIPVYSPANTSKVIGHISAEVSDEELKHAINMAYQARTIWGRTAVSERAKILNKAAELLQNSMPKLIILINQEGGRCILDAAAEVREAIDYCRYYGAEARTLMQPKTLPGPTGETNTLTLHPRGVIACISPWNFPLAIFLGQIVGALATGNTVIAKPSEQTPIIAYEAVKLLHRAGVPKDALQLVIGSGSRIGKLLLSDPRITGVIFTGSTETAKLIEQTLADRPPPIAAFIAETGGQNAMIVDSSALIEQTIIDIAQSAFNSAGQRCSALRVLFVHDAIADKLLNMLQGYMEVLKIGDPSLLETDIGPVIDQEALASLNQYVNELKKTAKHIATVPLPENLNGTFFAPCAYELQDARQLKGEVFGPILHVLRYREGELEHVLNTIINSGYGLTFGVQSRIDDTIRHITEKMPIGNQYVNRNMIGAVVGVQPFGGEGLSGTGPKAGGPHYLARLCVERTISINTTAFGGNASLVTLLEDD